ncbi:MAG: DUF1616 domain-containing protein [Methanobacterium sp.]|nr:DUF1616 domain-containing protein [Methanobacterium sp.]
MIENKSTDLKILVILTVLSLVFLFLPSLNQYPQNLVPYLLLLILLPGYALLAALKPDVQLLVAKRLLLSAGLGLLLYIVIFSLWSFTPLPVYINPLSVFLAPLEPYLAPLLIYLSPAYILSTILILDLVLIAWARRRILPTEGEKDRYLICRKCRGYYHLRDDESPEDFESCQCGGDLEYREETRKTSQKNVSVSAVEEPDRPQKPKKGSYYLDLLISFILGVICLFLILTDQTLFIGLVEILLILFLPGYALISLICTKEENAGALERLVYGVAASISLTAALGLTLNFTSWNTLEHLILILSILSLIFLVAAYLRRRSTPPDERYYPELAGFLKGKGAGYNKNSQTEKMLTILLILSVLLLAFTTYITANHLEGKPYTNFTVKNASGSTVNSLNLTSGETMNLTINLANHENKKTTYHLLVNSGSIIITDQIIILEDDEVKDVKVNLTTEDPGNRTLEFKLYKLPDNTNIYQIIKIPLIINEIIAEETTTEETTVTTDETTG